MDGVNDHDELAESAEGSQQPACRERRGGSGAPTQGSLDGDSHGPAKNLPFKSRVDHLGVIRRKTESCLPTAKAEGVTA